MNLTRINGFSQFAELTKSVRTTGKSVSTNCYLLPTEIENLAARGKLSWAENANGIIILRENQDFFNHYYYFADPIGMDVRIDFTGVKKPIVLDLLVKSGVSNSVQLKHEEFWQLMGFKFHMRNFRFHLDLPPGDRSASIQLLLDPHLYEHDLARKEDIPRIEELWRTALSTYTAPIPDSKEMLDLITTGQVFCIRNIKGLVEAGYRLEVRGKTAYFWQVVVDEKHRNRVKALDILRKQYLLHPEVASFRFWVEESNERVIKAVQMLGYVQDEIIDYQYILYPQ